MKPEPTAEQKQSRALFESELVSHLIRCPDVRSNLRPILDPSLLGRPFLRSIWGIVRDRINGEAVDRAEVADGGFVEGHRGPRE